MAGAACGERPHVRRLRPMPCTLQPRPRLLGALTWLFKGKESPPEREIGPLALCPHAPMGLSSFIGSWSGRGTAGQDGASTVCKAAT